MVSPSFSVQKDSNQQRSADTLIILDFETTGLSPNMGDRAIEIGAVKLEKGQVVDSFQRLMDPGFRINSFIENYTGISNAMLAGEADCETVMTEFADFVGDANLIAHNASFDKKFLDAEFERVGFQYSGGFSCSLLLSRRINQDAPSHKLGDLIRYKQIPSEGQFHRALFDAEMTAKLWCLMIDDIKQQYNLAEVPFALVQKICKTPKAKVAEVIGKWRGE
ncbi:DNA polymerase III subunit epsilon [Saccharobesus litoralis]|uniref:DNA-directed DNA polymerase n=1 Tax=Saccharobesus litoralis TaxID=2172099 RepID=A0A2S0VY42_9ALTE|nr:DNA polymerase III subunit epsilon [Saccharobesus litoralis]